MKKIRNSLLIQYLLIVIIATMIIPISMAGLSIMLYQAIEHPDPPNRYYNGTDLEKMWHETARTLTNASPAQIDEKLMELKKVYKEASLYWVDAAGQTRDKFPESLVVPEEWTATDAIAFMKENRGMSVDPFTVVAFIGEKKRNGFIVLQVPRSDMISPGEKVRERYDYILPIGLIVIFILFILISGLFFYRIRKRLLHLQEAMVTTEANGIPVAVEVKREDEVGRLELSFNRMVAELEAGKVREAEEEALRKELIANLSHDLRTPLTTIRGHAYRLKKEPISAKAQESLDFIDQKTNYMGELIDNLLSYTLLTSGKYPYQTENVDVIRLVRMSFAAWYPLFENLEFEIQLDIPEKTLLWRVDQQWFRRVLDNLFQNIYRHASMGRYVAVRFEEETLLIEDHGPGMKAQSNQKGVGVGLSIVSLMLKEMQLDWQIHTSEDGTSMRIKKV